MYVLVVDQCFSGWPHQTWEGLFWSVVCVHVAWWYCLGRGVAERTLPTTGRILVILLIPAVGAGAILLGIYATVFLFGFEIFVPFVRS